MISFCFCDEMGLLTVNSVMDYDRYVHPVHGARIVECLVNILLKSERATAHQKATVSSFLFPVSLFLFDKWWHNLALEIDGHCLQLNSKTDFYQSITWN